MKSPINDGDRRWLSTANDANADVHVIAEMHSQPGAYRGAAGPVSSLASADSIMVVVVIACERVIRHSRIV